MYAVIRVRGSVNVRQEIKDTLRMLHLTRVNHLALVDDSPSSKGMLEKVKDYVTWGEVDAETVALLLEKRGRLPGDKPIGPEFLKEAGVKDLKHLAQEIVQGTRRPKDIGLKPVFRLHPPVKGYSGIKRAYTVGGSLGYRGKAIKELIGRMVQ